ncbi:phosphoenolpyruvate mutase [Xenorhabdus bovienii]|uniref:phosphoenolpyruvate mutase n=1 Tax=Xenorhabdus bovienii TaxID=40576 RepID=UPI00237D0E94|nr:phosphoenolpyruvate mutase [Xenorhabdus bovienii]MDE1481691.1 phosphoenolpyruvate mutase [Xenorhabdus bovienii]MDE9434747.1 phosphoenolpyruvate mutase [Xenorhabdus bovienii]MDE9440518.1 phosphoenolpyruvate mutase [Xenorhabdus bovienii]
MLKKLLKGKKSLTFIEAHNPLSALIVKNANYTDNKGCIHKFDGVWSSSLTDSAIKCIPDNEILDINSRLQNIYDIKSLTGMPVIMDADTGGRVEHFVHYVRKMEQVGIDAVIIEDKTGNKRNSLFGTSVKQELADIKEFSNKISRGKAAQSNTRLMIFARLESLIAGYGIEDAFERANSYIKAGANGIMIHSCQDTPNEVIIFSKIFRNKYPKLPLICVPTTYSMTYHKELSDAGFNIIIYANHMLRAAYKAMEHVSHEILKHGRSAEIEKDCISIKKVISLIPYDS